MHPLHYSFTILPILLPSILSPILIPFLFQPFEGDQPIDLISPEVKLESRPIMNHGLQGLVTRPQGPGRQIADRSYYANDLRQRLQDITMEMQGMEDEAQHIENDNKLEAQLARRFENMAKEARMKEGQLADFNLALDKVRGHIDINELRAMIDR